MTEYDPRHEHREEMECRTGVIELVGPNSVTVKVMREKSCNACASKAHCGALFGSDTVLEIATKSSYQVGDKIEIGLNPSSVLKASLLFFIVPILLFFAGLLTGYGIADLINFDTQWTGFGLGLALMVAGYIGLKMLTPRLTDSQKYEPVIMRKLVD